MGPVITNQPDTQELVKEEEKRNPKMCNIHQQNPQQNQPWHGVYPDLSALNELFSPQAAVNSETFSSPWIAFLSSLGLQPIPGAQQQAMPAQEQPSAPPAPGTERQDGQTFSGSNSAAWSQGQGHHQSPPHSAPQPNGHTCGYSCGAPHISQLLQAITSRLLHFSSVATRASVTFFCILAFFCILSSLLLLLECRRGAERNTCRGWATLWLLPSTPWASTCRWTWRPREGREPKSSQL